MFCYSIFAHAKPQDHVTSKLDEFMMLDEEFKLEKRL